LAVPQQVWVSAEGWEGPADVGLLMAEKRGYFKDVGIDIWIGAPAAPSRPLRYVAEGTDYFGIVQQPQVAIAKDKGAPVVAVGSIIPQSTASLIWLKRSKIDGLAGLRTKTIAIPGVPFQEALLESVLAQGGLSLQDVDVERVGYELVDALVSGRADAIFGGSWNLEGRELKLRGADPVIKRVHDLGVAAYEEMVLIARTESVEEDPQLTRDFMTAVTRGTEAARSDPQAAVKVVQETDEGDPDLSNKVIGAEVRATLPLLSATGRMNPRQGGSLVEWMHDEGLIREKPPVSELLTNEYLGR
jgi:ABC-type nitrate/sulfonate/bicarbonate transport system substrate-binding protein